ncbi:MAG: hypothetical protein AAGK47_00885, partial [Bacteroidota bacterium]
MFSSIPQGWFNGCVPFLHATAWSYIREKTMLLLIVLANCFLTQTIHATHLSISIETTVEITQQPVHTQPCIDEEAYFSVQHTQPQDVEVTYQWQESTDEGMTWADLVENGIYLGTRLDRLAIVEPESRYGNLYRIIITDESTDPVCNLASDEVRLIAPDESLNDCNNEVNIAFVSQCSALITPDIILEGDVDTSQYTVVLEDFEGNVIPNPVTADYLCQVIIGRVISNCTGNECWAFLNIETKSAPFIEAPDDITVVGCEDIDLTQFTRAFLTAESPLQINDNCNIVETTFTLGQVLGNGCNTWTIEVVWRVRDACGNEGTDLQIINIRRPPIVIPSGTKEVECTSTAADESDFPCRPFLDVNENGVFNSDVDFYIQDADSYCNYGLISRVTEFDGCANSFKRAYTNQVIDWCSEDGIVAPHPTLGVQDNPAECTIIVSDNSPPLLSCPIAKRNSDNNQINISLSDNGSYVRPLVFSTDDTGCGGTASLNITAEDACQAAITFEVIDVFGQIDGSISDVNDNINNYEKLTRAQYMVTGSGASMGNGMAVIDIEVPGCRKYYAEVRAIDECGNATNIAPNVFESCRIGATPNQCPAVNRKSVNCRYFFEIQDQVAPVAVCDDNKSISFSATCRATLPASTFDGGSFDNCALAEDAFSVARAPAMGLPQASLFQSSITFTSEDLDSTECNGQDLELILRVRDEKGNFGYCTVGVELDDKVAPKCTNTSMEVSCAEYGFLLEASTALPDLEATLDQLIGAAVGTDNCSSGAKGIVSNVEITRDGACGLGRIDRTFMTEDRCGNQSEMCTQTLFVRDSSRWIMKFPKDSIIECNVATDIPPVFDIEDILDNRGCDQWAMNVDSTIFQLGDDGCYRIVRTYRLVNWCTSVSDQTPYEVPRDPNLILQEENRIVLDSDSLDERRSSIIYQQVVKVNQAAMPDLTILHDKECDENNDCFSRQDFQIIPDNPCSQLTNFTYYLVEDADNNGVPETSYADFPDTDPYGNRSTIGPTLIVTGDYPVGTHRFVFALEDICGNQVVRNYEFTVEDCTAPRADCILGLELELPAEGAQLLFAREFNASSADLCSNVVTFSYSENPADSIREYSCLDINRNIPIDLHVFDAAGNRDVCSTVLIVRPNDQIGCTEGAATIAGTITTSEGEPVDNVNVSLSGPSESSLMRTNEGQFAFMNVVTGGDYSVTPIKEDDYTNGVTTFDLVLIRKHILGLSRFDSPYKLLAADINRSGNISTFDMVELRKLILRTIDVFPSNSAWRFVDASHEFEDPSDPWGAFPEVYNINNLPEGYLEINFVAVKIGDVNISAVPEFQHTSERTPPMPNRFLRVNNPLFDAAQVVEVVFTAAELSTWAGCQLMLDFDANYLQYLDYESEWITEEHLNLSAATAGKIAMSWTGAADSDQLIRLRFRSLQTGQLAEHLRLDTTPLLPEAYDAAQDIIYHLGLDFEMPTEPGRL